MWPADLAQWSGWAAAYLEEPTDQVHRKTRLTLQQEKVRRGKCVEGGKGGQDLANSMIPGQEWHLPPCIPLPLLSIRSRAQVNELVLVQSVKDCFWPFSYLQGKAWFDYSRLRPSFTAVGFSLPIGAVCICASGRALLVGLIGVSFVRW